MRVLGRRENNYIRKRFIAVVLQTENFLVFVRTASAHPHDERAYKKPLNKLARAILPSENRIYKSSRIRPFHSSKKN